MTTTRTAVKPAAPPKAPGRLSLAAKRKQEHAARAVAPYAGGLAAAAGADLILHQPILLGLGARRRRPCTRASACMRRTAGTAAAGKPRCASAASTRAPRPAGNCAGTSRQPRHGGARLS